MSAFLSALLSLMIPAAVASGPMSSSGTIDREKDTLSLLKKIYDEVKEMGPYPGQSFTQQEFFAGGPDDDDTNKDQHVVVLIQNVGGLEKMKIQVTYLERSKQDRNVKYAKDVKNISCLVAANRIEITSSDYGEKEMRKIVPDILQAILNKKKLLKGELFGPAGRIRAEDPESFLSMLDLWS